MLRLTQTVAIFTLIALAAPVIAAEETAEIARVINVTGEGEATAPPDMATINTGVTTQGETARAALDQNNAAMKKLLAVLKEQGVAEKDVQTSNFSVHPVYDRDEENRRTPKVVAYRVGNQVQVRVRNLDSLGKVLDAVVSAGSNQISGIEFGIDDPSGILNEARSRAIRDAKERAGVYAQAAGVEVGRVLQISEQAISPPEPMRMGRMAFSAAAESVPIATGEESFEVTVNVMYGIK